MVLPRIEVYIAGAPPVALYTPDELKPGGLKRVQFIA